MVREPSQQIEIKKKSPNRTRIWYVKVRVEKCFALLGTAFSNTYAISIVVSGVIFYAFTRFRAVCGAFPKLIR